MKPFQMTEQQKRFFLTFGFLSFPGFFKDDIEKITEEFERVHKEYGSHHDGTKRSYIYPFPDKSEYLTSLVDDQRIMKINRWILGEEYNFVSGDGNYYVGDTVWHSDFNF